METQSGAAPVPEEGDCQHTEREDAKCLHLDLARSQVGVLILLLLCGTGLGSGLQVMSIERRVRHADGPW
jgi:hypothetical protein